MYFGVGISRTMRTAITAAQSTATPMILNLRCTEVNPVFPTTDRFSSSCGHPRRTGETRQATHLQGWYSPGLAASWRLRLRPAHSGCFRTSICVLAVLNQRLGRGRSLRLISSSSSGVMSCPQAARASPSEA